MKKNILLVLACYLFVNSPVLFSYEKKPVNDLKLPSFYGYGYLSEKAKAKANKEFKQTKRKEKLSMNFYDYSLITPSNEEISMSQFKGKVVMIVNTATACGFTPQYEPMEAMYEKFHSKGLEIIDVPCNQFGSQAPGTDDEIKSFCQLNYHTKFNQMKKSEVNGPGTISLYKFLKSQKGFEGFGTGKTADFMREHLKKIDANYEKNSDIKWNFTKFIIDRNGNVVKRFEPTADMEEVERFIKNLL